MNVNGYEIEPAADLSGADLSRCILCNTNLDGARVTYRGSTITIRFEETK